MSIGFLLIVILVIIFIAAMPTWGYSRGWGYGYYPSGIVFILVIVLLVLLLTGRL